MKKITILLTLVFCAMTSFAQTNIDNHTHNNIYIASSPAGYTLGEDEQLSDSPSLVQSTVPSYQQTKEWQKYQKLNKTGWIMFGGGLGGVLVGSAIMIADTAGNRIVNGIGATIAFPNFS